MAHHVEFIVYGNGNILYGDNGAYYDRDPLRKIKVGIPASFDQLSHMICAGIRIDPSMHQLEVFHRHPIFSKTMGVQPRYTLVPIIDNNDVENLVKMAELMGERCTQELFVKVHDGFIAPPEHRSTQEISKKEHGAEELQEKEKAEEHFYDVIRVVRDQDLAEQIGKDIHFDLVDRKKVRSFRIQKKMSFNLFKVEMAKEFGIQVQFQRYWHWVQRKNHTYRPHRPLTQLEEAQSVGQLRGMKAELMLYLEVERGLDLRPIALPDKTEEDILLFFKLYDPMKEELGFVGRLFVKASGKPEEILAKLNEMAGYPPHQEIELYEEIKYKPAVMCEPVDKKTSFQGSQLIDGDIICFQKAVRNVCSFFEHVRNRQA